MAEESVFQSLDLSDVSDHPDWFPLSAEQKQQVIDNSFQEKIATNNDFKKLSLERQEKIKLGYQQQVEATALNSQYNPDVVAGREAQAEVDNSSALYGTGTLIKDSLVDAGYRAPLVQSLVNDDTETAARNMSRVIAKRQSRIMTEGQKRLAADVQIMEKKREKDGFINDAMAIGEFMLKLPSNYQGILDTGAESSSSLASIYGGAKVGAIAGAGLTAATGGAAAPLIPVTTAIGMITAEGADAGTQKLIEVAQRDLAERGLAPTEANIQRIISQEGWMDEAQKTSLTYGGVLGLIDIALGGMASKIATLPTRMARRQAVRSMSASERAMIKEAARKSPKFTEKQITEDLINGKAANILKGQTFKTKLKNKAISYTGEVASEPASEAIATASIGEENTLENLVYETLGGIGAGPVGAAINTAGLGTKLGANKTGEFTKKILASTPESRAASKELKNSTQTMKKQADSRNAAKFNKEVEATDVNDPVVDEYVETDPVKAMAILAKSTDIDTTDKAETIFKNIYEEYTGLIARAQEIAAKESVTQQEQDEYAALGKQLEYKGEVLKQVDQHLTAIRNRRANEGKNKVVAPLDAEVATADQVVDHITDSMGSFNRDQDPLTKEQTDKLLNNPAIKGTIAEDVLNKVQEAKAAEEVVQTEYDKLASNPKNMDQVSLDIYEGKSGSEFKGIRGYKKAIGDYLAKKNIAGAEKQLSQFKTFRDSQVEKSDKINEAFKQAKKEDRKYGDGITVKHNGEVYEIHRNSGSFVNRVQNEATALNAEIALAEEVLSAKSGKTQASTEPVSSSSTTEQSAKPKIEQTIEKPKTKADPSIKTENWVKKLQAEAKTGVYTPARLKKMRDVYQLVPKENKDLRDRIKKFADEYKKRINAVTENVEVKEASVTQNNVTEQKQSIETPTKNVDNKVTALRRKLVSNHHTLRASVKHEYDQRLRNYDLYEALQSALESYFPQKGTVKNAVVPGGNGEGGTNTTVANGSINDAWAQEFLAEYDTDRDGVAAAINAALIGVRKPGVKQAKIIPALLDHMVEDAANADAAYDFTDPNTQTKTKESTNQTNTDNVVEKIEQDTNDYSSFEDVPITFIDVNGKEVTESFEEARDRINNEIADCKNLLACINL